MAETADERVRALLERAASGRKGLKAAAIGLADPTLRAELRAAMIAGGRWPADGDGWSAKRLLRRALDRSEQSQIRHNPIRRDEAFTCQVCGHEVPAGGARVRDHCPRCLCSLHVDQVPGDRAAGCGGVLRPVSVEQRHGDWILMYRCEVCAVERRCRSHPGDDAKALAEVARSSAV